MSSFNNKIYGLINDKENKIWESTKYVRNQLKAFKTVSYYQRLRYRFSWTIVEANKAFESHKYAEWQQ